MFKFLQTDNQSR